MSEKNAPLTADSTIKQWLNHPKGNAALEELLAQGGQSLNALKPLSALPLKKLMPMSQGALTPELVEALVVKANS
ncbi:hypothetical protein ACFVYC_14750 [Pseudarthrobacter sp. NPDC058329]|uniref:hypothetical protein n=1 Tax=Pseudarthrobacter sp. NPDC058329 TaxID=3346448 RepID=UPI0036DEFC3B